MSQNSLSFIWDYWIADEMNKFYLIYFHFNPLLNRFDLFLYENNVKYDN